MKKSSAKKAQFLFWGLFILLNLILFVPQFIAYYEVSSWYPSSTISTESRLGKLQLFFIRDNHDFFRIAAEFTLIISLLWLFIKIQAYQKIAGIFITVIFIILFYYNVYFEFYQLIYGVEPYFVNDFALLSEVLTILVREVNPLSALSWFGAVLAFLVVTYGLLVLVKILLRNFQKIKTYPLTKILYTALVLFILWSTYNYRDTAIDPHWPTVQWISPRFWNSMHLKNADNLKVIENEESYRKFLKSELAIKPDIYLIFIESYGTVATLAPELKNAYEALVNELQDSLDSDDWQIASAYSISPVKGGRSWLAFTSTMCGLKVENHLQYNDMLHIHYDYPHLVRYLNQQGYDTYRLSTMSNSKTDSLIPYQLINRFWGFDHWIKHSDLNYSGYAYDDLSGVPDQYALEYFEDFSRNYSSRPRFLFFISMTSHGPWYPPPPIVDDWRSLDQIQSEKPLRLEGETLSRYEQSIAYELKIFTRFIKEKASDNSIFILLGDHQPPTLEYLIWDYSDDAATPMHIISKDSTLINDFLGYGFQKGMVIDNSKKQYFQHQGLYSLLFRQLLKNYGKDQENLPEYFPNGLE